MTHPAPTQIQPGLQTGAQGRSLPDHLSPEEVERLDGIEIYDVDVPIHVAARLSTIPPWQSLQDRGRADEVFRISINVIPWGWRGDYTVLIVHASNTSGALILDDDEPHVVFLYKTRSGRLYRFPVKPHTIPPQRLSDLVIPLRNRRFYHVFRERDPSMLLYRLLGAHVL